VSSLFPDAELRFYRTTLAPPLIRQLTALPGGSLAGSLLEVIPFLRTHHLAAIRPSRDTPADAGA
jgi:hypothetical protein